VVSASRLALNGSQETLNCSLTTIGGPYEQFAGRECGVALATMSFDESLLDNVEACEELGVGDKAELENWKEKFEHYRCYPIMGRLVPDAKLPSSDRVITAEELSKFNGLSDEVPTGEYEGYARTPILVGALDKVFDCSFGGVPMYGKDGPYSKCPRLCVPREDLFKSRSN